MINIGLEQAIQARRNTHPDNGTRAAFANLIGIVGQWLYFAGHFGRGRCAVACHALLSSNSRTEEQVHCRIKLTIPLTPKTTCAY
jgi:hypothetical protein